MARKSRKAIHMDNDSKASDYSLTSIVQFNTAIYARISVETEEKRERGSMDNQVEFLKNFVDLQENLFHVETYIDDDITGTNFERPAFKKLIEDIKKGRINCIVVKDLSRFGRNYVETGKYIEKIFPFLKVRFIAINDRFDSFSNQDIVTPFKNIVNEIYAKDISKKICTSVLTRQKNGEYIGGMAAYGYLKDPTNKHKLVVDPVTAPIVKQIFDWKKSGLSYLAIARKLNEQRILSPTQYKYSIGILQKEKNGNHPWNALNVKRILINPIYLGNMVQGKYRQSFYNNQSRVETDESQWIIIPNTHEAIIDEDTFEVVKQQLAEINVWRSEIRNTLKEERLDNLFKGLIYCGQCGKKMVLHTSRSGSTKSRGKIHASYKCSTYREHLNQECADKRIKYDSLVETVKELLVEYSKLLMDEKTVATNRLNLKSHTNISSPTKGANFELHEIHSDEVAQKRTAEKRIDKIRLLDVKLYTDYAEGLLTKGEYIKMKGDYQAELAFLQKEIKVLEKSIKAKEKKKAEITKAKNVMEAYLKKNEITEEILQHFITRIEVHHKDTVKIQFKFADFVDKGKALCNTCGEGESNE